MCIRDRGTSPAPTSSTAVVTTSSAAAPHAAAGRRSNDRRRGDWARASLLGRRRVSRRRRSCSSIAKVHEPLVEISLLVSADSDQTGPVRPSSSLRAHNVKQKLLELPLFAADEPFL